MLSRLLAASRDFSPRRASVVRFSRCESSAYFWPLMNLRSRPVNRAYSCLRILSRASPRWRMMWNLSKRMAASGAFLFVELRNGFHMSITAISIFFELFSPRKAKKSSMLSSLRSCPPNQIARPRSRSLTMIRYWWRFLIEISSMPMTRGAGLPACLSCSSMYLLSSSLTVCQSSMCSRATSWMVCVRHFSPIRYPNLFEQKGLSSSHSNPSRLTLPHFRQLTRRRSTSR